jgi:hypothetical protein
MMKVRTLISSVLFALSCTLTVAAQSGSIQCDLRPARAPELRGLRLEMTASQLKARYPKLPVGLADNLGQLKMNLTGDMLAEIDPAAFKGVEHLSLYLIDNRLVSFTVIYQYLPWRDITQFTARMSEALKLPEGWVGNGDLQTLECNGFEVQTGRSSYGANGMAAYINFKEPGADNIVRERIEQQREQQLQSFKP